MSRGDRPSVLQRLWLWAPPALYMALIFHLSSESNPLPVVTALVWDKALHTAEYAVLAFLLGRAFQGEGMSRWIGLAALVATSLYGATDEWHQYFVPGRDSAVSDWLADTLGGGLGIVALSAFARLRRLFPAPASISYPITKP